MGAPVVVEPGAVAGADVAWAGTLSRCIPIAPPRQDGRRTARSDPDDIRIYRCEGVSGVVVFALRSIGVPTGRVFGMFLGAVAAVRAGEGLPRVGNLGVCDRDPAPVSCQLPCGVGRADQVEGVDMAVVRDACGVDGWRCIGRLEGQRASGDGQR